MGVWWSWGPEGEGVSLWVVVKGLGVVGGVRLTWCR